jgi:hypothetical protein
MRTDVSVEVRVNAEITVWTLLDYTKWEMVCTNECWYLNGLERYIGDNLIESNRWGIGDLGLPPRLLICANNQNKEQ